MTIPEPTADKARDLAADLDGYYAVAKILPGDVMAMRFDATALANLAVDALPAHIRCRADAERRVAELQADLEQVNSVMRSYGYGQGELDYELAVVIKSHIEGVVSQNKILHATLAACQEQLKHANEQLGKALDERDAAERELRSVRQVMAEQARLLRESDRAYACAEPADHFAEVERV